MGRDTNEENMEQNKKHRTKMKLIIINIISQPCFTKSSHYNRAKNNLKE